MENKKIDKFKDPFSVDVEYDYDQESKSGTVKYVIQNERMHAQGWTNMIQSLVRDDKMFLTNNIFLETNYNEPVEVTAVLRGKSLEAFLEKIDSCIEYNEDKNQLSIANVKEIKLNSDFGEKVISFQNDIKEYEKNNDEGFKCSCVEYINIVNIDNKPYKKQIDIDIEGIKNPENYERHKVKEYYREDGSLRERDTLCIKTNISKEGRTDEKIQKQESFTPSGKLDYSIEVINQNKGFSIEKRIETPTQMLSIRKLQDAERSIYVEFEDKLTGEQIGGAVHTTAFDQTKAKEIQQCLEDHNIIINYYDTLRDLDDINKPIINVASENKDPFRSKEFEISMK